MRQPAFDFARVEVVVTVTPAGLTVQYPFPIHPVVVADWARLCAAVLHPLNRDVHLVVRAGAGP